MSDRYEIAVLAHDEREARALIDSMVAAGVPTDPEEFWRVEVKYRVALWRWEQAHEAMMKALSA